MHRAHGDAREPRQRIGDVLVREPADGVGRHHVDQVVRHALGVESRLLCIADRGGDDEDFLYLRRLLGKRRNGRGSAGKGKGGVAGGA